MIKEHDRLVLREEIPDRRLKTGDVGSVIHAHKKGEAFEVKFVALDGETLAIATLKASQIVLFRKRRYGHRSVAANRSDQGR